MPTLYDEVNAKCPYYIRSSHDTIVCQGISDDSELVVSCKRKKERDRLKHLYCDKYYRLCPVYAMEEKEYEREVED